MDFSKIILHIKDYSIYEVLFSLFLFFILYTIKKFIDYLWNKKIDNKSVIIKDGGILPIDNPILYLWDLNMKNSIMNMNFECPFRDKLFKKMLKIRVQVTLDGLKDAFYNNDFNLMEKPELLNFWVKHFNKMKKEWNMKFYDEDIPKIIVDKFEDANAPVYEKMFSDLKNIIQQDNIYIDNNAKLCSITDLFYAENHHSFSQTMLLHQKLNGDLIGKQMGEQTCPCDEYKKTGKCRIGLVNNKILKEKLIS